MKAKLSLLPMIAVTALASCANVNRKVHVSIQAESPPIKLESSQTQKLSKAVNDYRATRGAHELQRHAGLDRLAQEHCEYMRKNRGTFNIYGNNVSHMGEIGRSLIAIRRYGMMNSSENVAWIENLGSEANNARGLVQLWSKSQNHEWSMSSDSWTHTGIGTVVDDDGSVFATQLFCTKSSSQSGLRELLHGF